MEDVPPTLEYRTPIADDVLRPGAMLWSAAGLVWAASLSLLLFTLRDLRPSEPRPSLLAIAFAGLPAAVQAWAIFRRSTSAAWLIAVPAWIVAVLLFVPCALFTTIALTQLNFAGASLIGVPIVIGIIAIANARWANSIFAHRQRLADANSFRGTL